MNEAVGAIQQKVRGEGACDELSKLMDDGKREDTGSLFQLMKIGHLKRKEPSKEKAEKIKELEREKMKLEREEKQMELIVEQHSEEIRTLESSQSNTTLDLLEEKLVLLNEEHCLIRSNMQESVWGHLTLKMP